MTDKQIIIDGVDVSECSWYKQGATGMICADWSLSNDCSRNLNCYYKQLKRKEQECEILKEKLEQQKGYTVSYKSYVYEQKKQLKAENEKLKLQATSLNYTNEIATLETENKHLINENEKLKLELSETIGARSRNER